MAFYYAKRRPAKCPRCGARRIARILYGLPAYSPELEKELSEGKIVLGGCVVTNIDPSWQCTKCETDIYKESVRKVMASAMPDNDG